MDVPTMEMGRAEALEKYREYRDSVKRAWNREDEVLSRGFRALAKGRRLINVLDAIRAAGLDLKGRPRLAILRADMPLCYGRRTHDGALWFASRSNNVFSWSRRVAADLCFEMPPGTVAPCPREWQGQAVAPSIPPRFRPAHSLAGYHILWEAEWETMPVDPILLRRLDGWIFIALAQWDLTPLERSILAARK